MPTLTDIAKLAGVSRSTVSLVLRESPLVADATRKRVRSAMEKSGYLYNRQAANLRTVRTDTVGIVVSDLTNPYYAELVAGAESILEQAGRVAFITHTEEALPRQDRFLKRMREQRVDGVLISAASGTRSATFQPFVDAGIPLVQIMRSVDTRRFDYVSGDNRLGLRFATEHLIGLGHRRIAYLGSSVASSVTHDRFAGYKDALARLRIKPDPTLVRECLPTWSDATAAMADLLALRDPPTALACFNDILALGAMLALSESGRQPGRDFAIVGFDDIQLASAWKPGLTTIAVRPREIGREAGNLLLERIKGSARSPQSILLAPRLVIRGSCGASLQDEVP
jgi:LacI family transcriptional regulator